jgi:tetratricopeptide (TPR) repeat protein
MRLPGLVFLLAFLTQAGWAETWLVAPFGNRSTDPQLDWLGESAAETIRESLADFKAPVVSREQRLDAMKRLSMPLYAAVSLATWIKVSEKTGADRLIHGEVHFTPAPEAPPPPVAVIGKADSEPVPSRGTLRVVARVTDIMRPAQLGEFVESGPLEELPSIQANLAWRILQLAKVAQLPVRREFRKGRVTVKVPALESYMRGLAASTPEAQHRYFTQAARLDPTFSHPRYYLGKMHFKADNYREAVTWLADIAREAPYYLEVQFMVGLSQFELSEFEASRQAFEEVVAQAPTPEAWNNLAAAQARLGIGDAFDNFRKALDARPGDPDFHFNMGYMLWKRGEFLAAAERFRASLDRLPGDEDALYLLGRCLKSSGTRPGDIRTEGLLRLKESAEEIK